MEFTKTIKKPFINGEPKFSSAKIGYDNRIDCSGEGIDINKGNEEIQYRFNKFGKKTEIEIDGDADLCTFMKIIANIMDTIYG